MHTMKSSFMSRCTVSSRLAMKSISSTGMNSPNRLHRCLLSSVTRSDRADTSASVGFGSRVSIHPVRHSSGKAAAPMSAGIHISPTWSVCSA